MTDPSTLPRLLRLALETPGDESALRRLTAELIRLGHDAPPTPTAEQMEAGARKMAEALFPTVTAWTWWPALEYLFTPANGPTIEIRYRSAARDGTPQYTITIEPEPNVRSGFAVEPKYATADPREALRQIRLAIDCNACEDPRNVDGPPPLPRAHMPESDRTRAWRLLYLTREPQPLPAHTRCPRCNDMRPTEDLTADHPICADCRGGFHVSQEDGGVTVNNYGTATPPALALAVANRHFDLTHPGASWSASASPNLIDDILRQARALQAEGDRINGGDHIPGADFDEALGAAWRTDREATLQTFGHLPQFRAMYETPTLTSLLNTATTVALNTLHL